MKREDIKVGQKVKCVNGVFQSNVGTIISLYPADGTDQYCKIEWDENNIAYLYYNKMETNFEIYIVDDCS